MPNIKSAIKRVRTTASKTKANKAIESSLKTSVKKFNEAAKSGNGNVGELFTNAVKSIDKAVAKKILHKNTAARKKSAIAKAANNAAKK